MNSYFPKFVLQYSWPWCHFTSTNLTFHFPLQMMKTLSGEILGHKMLKVQLHFRPFCIILLALLFLNSQMRICGGVSVMGLNPVKGSDFDVMVKRGCGGKSSECTAMAVEEEEVEMDSESNRRVLLMRRRYISYETLRRDLVPCDTPGASYYNCKGPGKANKYNRGCEIITKCAREVNGINSWVGRTGNCSTEMKLVKF